MKKQTQKIFLKCIIPPLKILPDIIEHFMLLQHNLKNNKKLFTGLYHTLMESDNLSRLSNL